MDILIVRKPVDEETLRALAKEWHGDFVKGVVDIKTGVVALGGEWHREARECLVASGADAKNIWGFNVYPDKKGNEAIEYTSHINIRPLDGNFDREIGNEEIRRAVRKVASLAVPFLGL